MLNDLFSACGQHRKQRKPWKIESKCKIIAISKWQENDFIRLQRISFALWLQLPVVYVVAFWSFPSELMLALFKIL